MIGGNEGGGRRAIERNGNVCLGDLYAHIAGLRAASHRTSLAADARACQGESTLSKQSGIFDRSGG